MDDHVSLIDTFQIMCFPCLLNLHKQKKNYFKPFKLFETCFFLNCVSVSCKTHGNRTKCKFQTLEFQERSTHLRDVRRRWRKRENKIWTTVKLEG